MLIAKSSSTRFKLVDGGNVLAGPMLHDPSGRSWSKNSLLCVRFPRGGREATEQEMKGAPRDYLGRGHRAHVSRVELPPRALADWDLVGAVETIYYTRPGTKAPGRYKHKFNAPRGSYHIVHLAKGKGRATLYRRGKAFRLELSKGSIVDDRGIVWP